MTNFAWSRFLARSVAPVGLGLFLFSLATRGNAAEDVVDDDNFRADVLSCEEAVTRLVECCPGFDPKVLTCEHYYSHQDGCGDSGYTTTSRSPALSPSESRCILDASCEGLRASDVCGRAQRATAYVQESGRDSTGKPSSINQTHPPVCP